MYVFFSADSFVAAVAVFIVLYWFGLLKNRWDLILMCVYVSAPMPHAQTYAHFANTLQKADGGKRIYLLFYNLLVEIYLRF